MSHPSERRFKRNLLCISPPYGNRAPAGSAYLLGYLQAHGCDDFDFVDLRLSFPMDFTPTYCTTGSFGESYVLDVPDLALVLQVLEAFDRGSGLAPEITPLFERFCIERSLSPAYVHSYLVGLERYLTASFEQIPRIDFIGFSVWTPNFLSTLMAAAILKRRPHPPVIVAGGPQVTASRASAALGLRSGLFDTVALGEGEATILDVYRQFESCGDVGGAIPGTRTVDPESGALHDEPRPPLKLSELPPPSFNQMQLQAYQGDDPLNRTVPLQLSRGCTDKCSFCSEWVFWESFRPDTTDHVIDHLQRVQRDYGVTFVEFSDSLLNGVKRRLVSFAEEILRCELEIGWTGFMRADMDSETARLMSRAGCSGVFLGVESFSDEALQAMNKRMTEAQNIRAIRAFLDEGILVTAGFIPGFPGDSREGFLHSVAVLRQLQSEYPGRLELHQEPFTVLPNAPMFGALKNWGLVPRPWADDYLDVAPRYRDIVEEVFCTVEGESQGLERMGRSRIVGAVKVDTGVTSTFIEGEDDGLSVHEFRIEHIYGGWSLGEKQSSFGHRYALLIDEQEVEELQELEAEHYPIDESKNRPVTVFLAKLERRHVIAPERRSPRVVRTLYRKSRPADATYSMCPYVVARSMGWRRSGQVLCVDVVTRRSHRQPREDELLLTILARGTHTLQALTAELERRGQPRKEHRVAKVLDDLLEAGILTVCSMPQEEKAARKTRRLGDNGHSLPPARGLPSVK